MINEIQKMIPHRPPFLFLDKILETGKNFIKAEKKLDPAMDIFKGHYPNFPIVPGVITCESIFQAGAVLLSKMVEAGSTKVPVLTKIRNARFKQMIHPGDNMQLVVELVERIGDVFYLKGKAQVDGKTAVAVEYSCALAEVKK